MEFVQNVIAILILFIAPFLVGNLFLKKTISGTYISGVLLMLGLFELVSVKAVRGKWNFIELYHAFLITEVLLFLAGTACFFVRRAKGQWRLQVDFRRIKKYLWLVPAFCLALAGIFACQPKLESWYLVPETVTTILDTNSLHGYHPLTGQPLAVEKSFRDSLYNLPAFYACLLRCFGIGQEMLLFRVIPVFVLLVSFFVFYQIGVYFFSTSAVGEVIFLWVYALVLVCGENAYMNEAYQLLHYAYEGRAVLSSVLLPYCFYLLLSFFDEKGKITRKFQASFAELVLVLLSGVLVMGIDYGLGLSGMMLLTGGTAGAGVLLWSRRKAGKRA